MRNHLSTANPGFSPLVITSLSFEGTGSTIDPPDNQGGGTAAPEPEKDDPKEEEIPTESD